MPSLREGLAETMHLIHTRRQIFGSYSVFGVMNAVNENISKLSELRFYPAREVIVSEAAGVQEISPLIALPAPTADVSGIFPEPEEARRFT